MNSNLPAFLGIILFFLGCALVGYEICTSLEAVEAAPTAVLQVSMHTVAMFDNAASVKTPGSRFSAIHTKEQT